MTPATTTRPINRRPHVERRVLTILRGAQLDGTDDDSGCSFARLRRLAQEEGHLIMPPGTRYLSDGELVILSWLAAAQRIIAPRCRPPRQDRLAMAIERCADELIAMRLRLYPLSLYAHRVRG